MCLQAMSDSSLDGLLCVLPEGASQGFPPERLPSPGKEPAATVVQRVVPDPTLMARGAATGIAWSQLLGLSCNSILQGPNANDNNVLGCSLMDTSRPPQCSLVRSCNGGFGPTPMPMPSGLANLMHGHIFTPPITQATLPYIPPADLTTTSFANEHGSTSGWSRGRQLAEMNRVQALNDPEYLRIVAICSSLHFEQKLDLYNRLKTQYDAKMRELKQFSTQ